MRDKKLLNCLLKMLDNKEVQEKIRGIAAEKGKEKTAAADELARLDEFKKAESNLKETENKLKETESKLEETESNLKETESKLKETKSKLEKTESNLEKAESNLKETEKNLEKAETKIHDLTEENKKLEEQAKKAKQTAEEYENNYSKAENLYRKYKSLGANIHEDLKRVFKAENPIMFVCEGVQWSNLDALWELLSYKAEMYEKEDYGSLCEIFDVFFDIYAQVNKNCRRLNVNVGEEFDEEKHTRMADSAVSGSIREIVLRGYEAGGKVKKSVVRV